MRQYFVTLAFFVAALACYTVGAANGAITLAAIGFALESIFWIRVLVARRATRGAHLPML